MIAPATSAVAEGAQEVKPKLRGWLHLVTFPLSVAAGVVLVCLAPTTTTRIAVAIFAFATSLLFGVSALFHCGHWGSRWHGILRRLDHSNIFLLISGTYTPFAIALLNSTNAKILLAVVWGAALVGIASRVFLIGAPRWLYLPVYLVVGWSAVFWLGDFARAAGVAVLTLILVGGGLYSLGGLIYGLRRPNPLPRWFGYHEIFHSCTVAALAVHYIGISIVVYSRR